MLRSSWCKIAFAGGLLTAFTGVAQSTPEVDNTYYKKLANADPADILDRITDIAADSARHVLITDQRLGRVLLLNAQLQVIGQVGRKGAGPGEYREVQAVRGTRNGFVTIDRVLRRVYTYDWLGDRPKLVRSVRLDFEPYDFCPMAGNKALVLGRRQGFKVHIIDGETGAVLQSGDPFPKNMTVALADNLIEGRLSCGGDKSTFIITSAFIPKYDVVTLSNLQLVKVDSIYPVRSLLITSTPKSESFGAPRDGYHSPIRAFGYSTYWIIQADILARSDGKDNDSIPAFIRSRTTNQMSLRMRIGKLFPIGGDSAVAVLEKDEIVLRKVSLADVVQGVSNKAKPVR